MRVVVVRTQNFPSTATRGSRTLGSVPRGSGTNAKFSKPSRTCNWYERKIFKVQPRVVVVRVVVVLVVVVRTQNFLVQGARGSGTNVKFFKSRSAW